MRRLITTVLLLGLCGSAAADITMLLDPSGKPVPNGRYRLLVIPADATKAPSSTLLDVGFGVDPPAPPDVPTPPPPDTLDAKLTLLLAAVEDGEKAATAGKLKIAYEMTLQLTANSITDANSLRGVMAGIDKGVLDSLKKTAAWKPWTDGLAELVKPLDFQGCLTAYRAAASKLGGGPNPPQPPGPVGPVKSALLLMAPEAPDQALSLLTNKIRNDRSWSSKIQILNSTTTDENNQLDPLVKRALDHLQGNPLPQLLLIDAAGGFVDNLPVPATWEAAKTALTAKGLKP